MIGRRRHRRWVNQPPNNLYFAQEPPKSEDAITITIAEFEAMRLKHFLGLNQKEAAERMGVSQPTFSRILENAHQKNTIALLEGKEIKVYGGNFEHKPSFKGYGCLNCNYEWEDPEAKKDQKVSCIKCNSKNVYYIIRELI